MGRQTRAKATRKKILDAAVDLFSQRGYSSTGLGDIIDRARITKGALYYHFDSKESLATAIIEDATDRVIGAFDGVASSASPALETMIHGSFVVLSMTAHDDLARAGRQLAQALGQFSEAGATVYYRHWTTAVTTQARKAGDEGDLRPDVDPDVVAQTIIAVLLGVTQLSAALATGANDMLTRLTWAWEMLLPGIASEESLDYFQQYLSRASVRFGQPVAPPD
ncbi:TetR/AcrR family transcriptional regulator [Mycolicibacterium sp. CH28]|uniref:ScbR family autoregulator-binding transcription factor n=1 Tax=Mycolicibacterium sp. CH28 TaxID=2512237 RepID=UPI00108019DA|nr:ScbR family autoregulator-binding transcription factor [Mycolicibacterium sp. CH28]TGD89153.1 TetR/AcrR family transcriptional regulator [Mycolicibacterium sp. CH28]